MSQLQRQLGRVAEALARRETVQLTKHGETVADITPRQRGMSGADFAARWNNRKRMDAATCDAGLAALKELDQAA